MAIDEAARHELYRRLEATLGPGPTSTMMSLLPQSGWSDVARDHDVALLRAELHEDFAELRAEFAELRAEFAELRAEFADLRGEVAASQRQQTLTLVGAMVTISGLTVAAAGLL